jgi:hypothetical protein
MLNLAFQLMTANALDGPAVMRTVEARAPELLPTRIGNREPAVERFSWDRLQQLWSGGEDLVWRVGGRRSSGEAQIMRPLERDPFAYVSMHVDPSVTTTAHIVDLLLGLHEQLGSTYGFVHPITEDDRGRAGPQEPFINADDPFLLVTADDLQLALPTLFWANVIGLPFVDLIGRDRLLAAPVHRATELGHGAVYLQLTPELADIADAYPAFDRVRAQAIEHLGRDAFYDPARGETGDYRHVVLPGVSEPAPGDVADAVDLIRRLTSYGTEGMREARELEPLGVVVFDDGRVETVGAQVSTRAEAVDTIREAVSQMAGGPHVVLAAICEEDSEPVHGAPDRRLLKITLHSRGEEPFQIRRPVLLGASSAELGEAWSEPAPYRLLAGG